MQTSNLESRYHECSLFRRVIERVSTGHLVDSFGQGAQSGAEKGVI
jgi:hypothetical protein